MRWGRRGPCPTWSTRPGVCVRTPHTATSRRGQGTCCRYKERRWGWINFGSDCGTKTCGFGTGARARTRTARHRVVACAHARRRRVPLRAHSVQRTANSTQRTAHGARLRTAAQPGAALRSTSQHGARCRNTAHGAQCTVRAPHLAELVLQGSHAFLCGRALRHHGVNLRLGRLARPVLPLDLADFL